MTKKFLLHKDNKENATAQMAHLVLPDTKAHPSQNQKSHFLPTHPSPPTNQLEKTWNLTTVFNDSRILNNNFTTYKLNII